MRVGKNISLLERHAVFMNMAFVIPVIMPFYRDEMGLNFRDFLLGEAAFAATVVLLEVPSGWLSDVWQRRWVMVLGTLTQMLGYALLMVADSLVMAALSQSVIGVGISLMSGTNSALLYDSLLSEGREGEYRMREGRRVGLALYSVAGASIVGGFLYAYDHYLPLILSLITQTIALVMAWQMVEPERHRVAAQKHPVADMIETARYALHGHAEVGLIIVFSAVMFSATKVIMWSQQPYYMAMGLDERYFGLMMAAGFVLGGLSRQHSHRRIVEPAFPPAGRKARHDQVAVFRLGPCGRRLYRRGCGRLGLARRCLSDDRRHLHLWHGAAAGQRGDQPACGIGAAGDCPLHPEPLRLAAVHPLKLGDGRSVGTLWHRGHPLRVGGMAGYRGCMPEYLVLPPPAPRTDTRAAGRTAERNLNL
ncbi:MAG: major Facilitator Superfamily protein [Alphaproteobacteria bacterium]|nr:major Facilitator Superfamily protein [Alphaproteobacteria bacterium]